MNIRAKLLIGFLSVAILAALVGYWQFRQLEKVARPLENDVISSIKNFQRISQTDALIARISHLGDIVTQSVQNFAFTGNVRGQQRYFAHQSELDQKIADINRNPDAENGPLFRRLAAAWAVLRELETAAIEEVARETSTEAVDILESEAYWSQKRIFQSELQSYFLNHGIGEKSIISIRLSADNARQVLRESTIQIVVFIGIIVLVSVVVGASITRSITQPLSRLIQHTNELGRDGLNRDIEISLNRPELPGRRFLAAKFPKLWNDELGDLATSFNRMTT